MSRQAPPTNPVAAWEMKPFNAVATVWCPRLTANSGFSTAVISPLPPQDQKGLQWHDISVASDSWKMLPTRKPPLSRMTASQSSLRRYRPTFGPWRKGRLQSPNSENSATKTSSPIQTKSCLCIWKSGRALRKIYPNTLEDLGRAGIVKMRVFRQDGSSYFLPEEEEADS